MRALKEDFEQQSGQNYLIIREIEAHLLSDLQSEMLQRHSIPHVLPLEIRRVNFNVTLRYEITEMKMIQHLLKVENFSNVKYWDVILQFIKLMEDSDNYMLYPENYLLDLSHIFYEGTLANGYVFVPYLPLKEKLNEQPVRLRLKELATQLIPYVQNIKMEDYQRFIEVCHLENCTLLELKNVVLDSLMKSRPTVDIDTIEPVDESTEYSSSLTERKIYVPISGIGVLVVAWKILYFDGVIFYGFEICIIITILIAILVYFWYKRGITNQILEEIAEENTIEDDDKKLNLSALPTTFLEVSEKERKTVSYLECDGKKLELTKQKFVIGRLEGEVDLLNVSHGTSRLHVEIFKKQDEIYIKDLGSTNGTWLQGQLIVPYREYFLKDKSRIKIGQITYTYYSNKKEGSDSHDRIEP